MQVAFRQNMTPLWSKFQQTEGFKTLDADQVKFFQAVFANNNVLLTGPAGTGKSYCIKLLFDFLREQNIFVGKSALTGVAALNIGGSTIHSWAGLGLADKDIRHVVDEAMKKRNAKDRIRNSPILFVDEVSMASADLIDKLDAVLQNVRLNRQPFGGMQIIFSGDFLQLPPVFRGFGNQLKFAFQSDSWVNANIKTVSLEKLVRQDETTPFAKLLQKIRYGKREDLGLLATRIDSVLVGEIPPIKIFCRNIDINAFNMAQYNKLTTPEQIYKCNDTGDGKFTQVFDKNCPAPGILHLKVGAQVMLLHNFDTEAGLVNGKIGIVQGFSPLGPIVKFEGIGNAVIEKHKWELNEQELDLSGRMRYKVVATRSQIPLKLAWATSVHKQQGCTLDRAEVDLSAAFEYGQVYVALSRVRTLEGLSLSDFSPNKIKAHPECLKFYQENK